LGTAFSEAPLEMATYLDNYNNGEYCTGNDAD
jgi:hypothetical protein